MGCAVPSPVACVRSPCTNSVYARYTSSPDCAIDGKSSSSLDDVNWNCAPVCATSALPPKNVLLVPNGTSLDEKVKFPCAVVTSNFTGDADAPTFTISPFSCTGPGGLSEGVACVLIFQLVVPLIASVPSNRHPRRISTGAPVTAIDPSQFVTVVAPTPRITRNDCDGASVVVAAWIDTVGTRNRRHNRIVPAAIATSTIVL